MATVSELSMYQAMSLQQQAEVADLRDALSAAQSNVVMGRAPSEEAEREWKRIERKMTQQAAAQTAVQPAPESRVLDDEGATQSHAMTLCSPSFSSLSLFLSCLHFLSIASLLCMQHQSSWAHSRCRPRELCATARQRLSSRQCGQPADRAPVRAVCTLPLPQGAASRQHLRGGHNRARRPAGRATHPRAAADCAIIYPIVLMSDLPTCKCGRVPMVKTCMHACAATCHHLVCLEEIDRQ